MRRAAAACAAGVAPHAAKCSCPWPCCCAFNSHAAMPSSPSSLPLSPPQWHQWLHKARDEAPTAEDIQRGIHQRELYKQRIAEIEREEAQRSFQARSGGGRAGGGFTQQLPGGKE